MAAAILHVAVLILFTFTFSSPSTPSKPAFVFLGSFLRQQDVMLPSAERGQPSAGLNVREVTLDSKGASWPGKVRKPSLSDKAAPQEKSQYKPVAAEPLVPFDNEKKDDLDEFGPIPPVKMKINTK